MNFKLKSDYKPTGDQPIAINQLTEGLNKNLKHQTLLGVTGSGKTFTIANVIKNVQRPTLVISHNKTLAAQLYQEFRDFFPENAVSYFVSYYDYYQPEAYIPQTDTYIPKDAKINDEIDKLRLAATTNILTRKDVIVVASVSCIYNIGSPVEYGRFILEIRVGVKINREDILKRLVDLQYERNDYNFTRSTFRVRGDTIEILPSYDDYSIRIQFSEEFITKIEKVNPLTGETIENLQVSVIYPAKHYMTDPKTYSSVFNQIKSDLADQVSKFKKEKKLIEAQRIDQRVNYDLQMIKEMGYVDGIENYSRYFDGRNPGDSPYSLMDYFSYQNSQTANKDWLLIVDESHITLPQIRGMSVGDRSRKQTLIDFGFRLPSALDNRPLKFEEFQSKINHVIYVSATPDAYEKNLSVIETKKRQFNLHNGIVEQLIRPTGLIDPEIIVKPTKDQIRDLIQQIIIRKKRGERVLVTTLTKKMAEELSEYLMDISKTKVQLSVHYLHADIKTLERTDILDDLRLGKYDVIVGINLLREGLDLPEVSLVAILDADREGFLRSATSLIQIMGRSARNVNSVVIMYADKITDSMKKAMDEVNRRRIIQKKYNEDNGITPKSIIKPIRKKLIEEQDEVFIELEEKRFKSENLTPEDKQNLIKKLNRLMREAASNLDFEEAAKIRDKIKEISA